MALFLFILEFYYLKKEMTFLNKKNNHEAKF